MASRRDRDRHDYQGPTREDERALYSRTAWQGGGELGAGQLDPTDLDPYGRGGDRGERGDRGFGRRDDIARHPHEPRRVGQQGTHQLERFARSTSQGDDGLYEMRGGLATQSHREQRYGEQQRDERWPERDRHEHERDDHRRRGWFGRDRDEGEGRHHRGGWLDRILGRSRDDDDAHHRSWSGRERDERERHRADDDRPRRWFGRDDEERQRADEERQHGWLGRDDNERYRADDDRQRGWRERNIDEGERRRYRSMESRHLSSFRRHGTDRDRDHGRGGRPTDESDRPRFRDQNLRQRERSRAADPRQRGWSGRDRDDVERARDTINPRRSWYGADGRDEDVRRDGRIRGSVSRDRYAGAGDQPRFTGSRVADEQLGWMESRRDVGRAYSRDRDEDERMTRGTRDWHIGEYRELGERDRDRQRGYRDDRDVDQRFRRDMQARDDARPYDDESRSRWRGQQRDEHGRFVDAARYAHEDDDDRRQRGKRGAMQPRDAHEPFVEQRRRETSHHEHPFREREDREPERDDDGRFLGNGHNPRGKDRSERFT